VLQNLDEEVSCHIMGWGKGMTKSRWRRKLSHNGMEQISLVELLLIDINIRKKR
jgi:hypothetical protein